NGCEFRSRWMMSGDDANWDTAVRLLVHRPPSTYSPTETRLSASPALGSGGVKESSVAWRVDGSKETRASRDGFESEGCWTKMSVEAARAPTAESADSAMTENSFMITSWWSLLML